MAETTTFNFTVARLAKLEPPAKGEVQLNDTGAPGLSIRLRASGGATFICRYVVAGSGSRGAKRFVIGPVSETPLEEARRKAAAVIAAARAGRDPVAERKSAAKEAIKAAETGLTIGELVDLYEKHQHDGGVQSAGETGKRLRTELRDILKEPAVEVTRAQLVRVLDRVRVGVPGHAAPRPGLVPKLQANIHGLLAFGLNAGRLQFNVMSGYRAPRGTKKQQALQKAKAAGVMLSMEELAAIWRACDDGAISRAFGSYVRMLIITGARRDEMAKAQRGWLHAAIPEEPARIIIPGEHTKNGKAHYLPLPPLAMAVIAQAPQLPGTRLIFPGGVSRKTGKAAKISGWSKTWPKVIAAAERFGLSRHVTIHELRKALRSHYSRLGFGEIGELQLNHTPSDRLAAIYDLYDRKAERIAAATRWCAEIETALAAAPAASAGAAETAQVVQLHKAARTRKVSSIRKGEAQA